MSTCPQRSNAKPLLLKGFKRTFWMSSAHPRCLMREQFYDPFGDEAIEATTHAPMASAPSYVGIATFWCIVVALVVVRVFYFG